MAFGFYTAFTVNTGQVPSTQTNFPVGIIDNTGLARLADTGHSGHVQNSNGYDIRPYSDSTLTTPLTYELVYYDGATGKIEMWVKVPSLSDGYVIYLAYGDSGISTDGSSTSTWNSNYLGVWHLSNGTSLSVSDSTSNNIIGTNSGATATTGKIDGGGAFASASSQHIDITDINAMDSQAAFTVSAWANWSSITANQTITGKYDGSKGFGLQTYISGTSPTPIVFFIDGSNWVYTTSSVISATGTWYHIVGVFDNSLGTNKHKIYIDGTSRSLSNQGSPDGVTATGNSTGTNYIGRLSSALGRYFNGNIDELRVSNSARSANWITTEYNNQSAPTTFYAVGTEQTVGGGGGVNSGFLLFF